MAAVTRFTLGLLAGAIVTYLLGTAVNSQFVMNAHGVPVSWGDRLNMTLFDISNMLAYLAIIAVSFLIAFLIARVIKRFLPNMADIAYPIAGAAAMGTALGLMYMIFQTVPISGARSTAGFLAQMIAGGIGGWIFAKVASR
ncbi:hypothetical protein SAMN02745824_0367 [Parasphingorhabdus marina DSM 22363]|uniref:Uncharacterized protein n=1 Tax=Parasphingorhabdus marina DSM 22363 TaxID=1123272 RepID=A0A1N6CMN3_9SPHN|nr:hypothetical protein [Parasphingorhabdus marina]SIN59830.1 hypothetical protein SAMN02745824_0367 [Parasphingorhabdus marina DSM 22363]